MRIIEFRIVMPLTVTEYQRGSLYMIAKSSRMGSKPGEGVEIVANEPFTDEQGNSGQFTHKIYHLGTHMPSIVERLAPKDALQLVEKSHNAFPSTYVPLVSCRVQGIALLRVGLQGVAV